MKLAKCELRSSSSPCTSLFPSTNVKFFIDLLYPNMLRVCLVGVSSRKRKQDEINLGKIISIKVFSKKK